MRVVVRVVAARSSCWSAGRDRGLLIALHTDAGRDRLRREIESQLADVFVHGMTIGQLDGSVLGEVELRDVAIPGADGTPVLSAAVVRARVRPWSLVGRVIDVGELEIEGVDVDTTRLAGLLRPRPQRTERRGSWSSTASRFAAPTSRCRAWTSTTSASMAVHGFPATRRSSGRCSRARPGDSAESR